MIGQSAVFNPGSREEWRQFLASLCSEDLCGIFHNNESDGLEKKV